MSTLEVKAIQAPSGQKLAMPAGHILQVVQGLNTNTLNSGFLINTTSSSYVAVPLSAAITPISTSSKILVSFTTSTYRGGNGSLTIYAGNTNIGDSTHGLQRMTGAQGYWAGESHTVLHSPNTTNAITYQLYCRSESGNFYVGGDGGVRNTITLMEVAG